VALDKNLSRGVMRMLWRFRHGQDRREADVGALHDLAPVLARLAQKHLCQLSFSAGQALRSIWASKSASVSPACWRSKRIELRLDRSDRDEIAAGAFIDAVEMRAAVEEVLISAFRFQRPIAVMSKNIDISEAAPSQHRGIDHLALAGF